MTLEKHQPTDLVPVATPVRERARQHLVARRVATVAVTRRQAWTAWRIARQLPATGWWLLVYSPRGAGRLLRAWSRYLRDVDTSDLRSHHAGAKETPDYARISRERGANLRARLLVSALLVVPGVLLLLAWLAPGVLAWVAGGAALAAAVKLLPRKEWWEILIPPAAAGVAWRFTPDLAARIPHPPGWLVTLAAAAVVVVCGWHGRQLQRPLVTMPGRPDGGSAAPVTAPMVTAALVALGNAKMKEPDGIDLLMDVARDAQGYTIDLQLPPAVLATWVIEKRAELAAALRRELGTVWPSVGARHPGHLALYVAFVPTATARQLPWPLARGTAVNLFEPLPLFTDQRGQWVYQTLAYTAWVIGAVPRMGKTRALLIFALVAALDVRTRLYVFDLKGTGDLTSVAEIAERSGAYGIGDEPDELEEQLVHMRRVRAEMRRRTRLVRQMTLEENPERGKITDALASRDPANFGPIVIIVDECQVWFEECDDKDMRNEFIRIVRDLVKRGPALGIIPFIATQKPDTKSIPSAISANASGRLCLKVNGQVSNDQVLGTSMYQAGIRATQFGFAEKGVAYLVGDGAEPLIVRTVFGSDAGRDDELAAQALALRAGLTLDTPAVVDAELVLDVVHDCAGVLVDRGLDRAHLAALAGWLREHRAEYTAVDADALGRLLREEGVTVKRQMKVGGVNSSGVLMTDLRKQLDTDEDEAVGETE